MRTQSKEVLLFLNSGSGFHCLRSFFFFQGGYGALSLGFKSFVQPYSYNHAKSVAWTNCVSLDTCNPCLSWSHNLS